MRFVKVEHDSPRPRPSPPARQPAPFNFKMSPAPNRQGDCNMSSLMNGAGPGPIFLVRKSWRAVPHRSSWLSGSPSGVFYIAGRKASTLRLWLGRLSTMPAGERHLAGALGM